MKLCVIAAGQAGCNIADRLIVADQWIAEQRDGIRIFPQVNNIPSVFAVNIGKPDLESLENIPRDEDHRILIGTVGEFHGRGAGKVNVDGAEQTKKSIATIVNSVRENGNIEDADAILVIASTAGGTGSGGVGVIVDALKQAFQKPVYALLVLPFESSYEDADTMVNTATCLQRVLYNSRADATILVSNQRFVQENEAASDNLTEVNDFIANAVLDLFSAGEETQKPYIGLVKDARDIINILRGPTAIAAHFINLPSAALPQAPPKKGWWGRKSNPSPALPSVRDFAEGHKQGERILQALNIALSKLSVECACERDGKLVYPAGKAFALISGPSQEATTKAVGMLEEILAEKMPDAGSISVGTYPGRRSETLGITLIVSDLGEGAAMDLVHMFFEKAIALKGEVDRKRNDRKAKWDALNKLGKDLPSL